MKINTQTRFLSVRQRRDLVQHVINWMHKNVGEKSTKYRTFKYKVMKLPEGYTPAYGMYDAQSNTMFVFHNYCPTVKWIIRAVLHEYTHYLQNLRYYHTTLAKVGYTDHPQEKQANLMESLHDWVWEDISPLMNS
jgi:hypothetical protein